jgi:thiol:disulfide interchange protein DsbD
MYTSMKITLLALVACWLFYAPVAQGCAIGPDTSMGRASIEVRSDVGWIGPGQSFNIIVVVSPDKDWHVYWKNPGASGAPTVIEIDSPEGFKVGEPIFPRPSIFRTSDGSTYGYSELVAIFVPVTAPQTIDDETATFEITTSWLACKKICVLGENETKFTMSTNPKTQGPLHRDLRLVRWQKLLPNPLSDLDGGKCHIDNNTLHISGTSDDRVVSFIGVERLGIRFGKPKPTPTVVQGGSFSMHIPLTLDFSAVDGEPIVVEGLLTVGRNRSDPSYVVRIIANPEIEIR